ncbi:alpha/beta fold hydrolase [Croceibacterium xixiisoli]|nr:alpha/beta fold hydrolase [Croceibacterium xixiisoli]
MNLLLIPGFMLDADLWRDMRAALAEIGDVVLADLTRDDTLGGMADRAIAALSRPALVVGFSMGGYVAREIAYRAPDRVAGLALVATSSRAHGPQPGLPDPAEFRQIGRAAVMRSLHPDHGSDANIQRVQAMSRRAGRCRVCAAGRTGSPR